MKEATSASDDLDGGKMKGLVIRTVKAFIGYILREFDQQDSKVLTRQKETIRSRGQQLLSKA